MYYVKMNVEFVAALRKRRYDKHAYYVCTSSSSLLFSLRRAAAHLYALLIDAFRTDLKLLHDSLELRTWITYIHTRTHKTLASQKDAPFISGHGWNTNSTTNNISPLRAIKINSRSLRVSVWIERTRNNESTSNIAKVNSERGACQRYSPAAPGLERFLTIFGVPRGDTGLKKEPTAFLQRGRQQFGRR